MSCSSAKAMSQYFPGGVRTVHSLYRTVHILSRLARCPSFARDSLVYSSGPVTDLCRCAKGRVSYWPRRRQWGGYGCCLRLSVSLSVFFPHDIWKPDAARITKLDTEMFQDESWKPIYFGVRRSKVKVTIHRNIADVDLCTLLSAGFF